MSIPRHHDASSRPSIYQRLVGLISVEKHTELVFLLSAMVGISPLVLVNGKPRILCSLLIYSIFFTSTVLYLNISDYLSNLPYFPTKFHRNIIWVSNLLFLFQPIVYFSTSVLNFRKLSNIRHCLRSVDSLLRNARIYEGKEHVSVKRMLYLLLLLAMIVAVCTPEIPIKNKLVPLGFVNFILGSGQYSALGMEFSYHLRRIVRCLRRMKGRTDQTGQAERLVLLSKAHHQLCSSIEEFSSCYGFQILYIVIIQFLNFLIFFFLFLWIHNFIYHRITVFFLFFICPAFITSALVIDCSAKMSEKSKEVNLLLYHLMIKDKSNELLNNEKLLLHISMKREVVLTVCGLFNLDYTFMHSMVAAVATYVVVMFQFL
ncbi:Gustatory receptor 38 [Halyomorpha halys]|nr:Gustatory receptor 38 [Halyomorpha halys]